MKRIIFITALFVTTILFSQLRWGTTIVMGDKFVRGDSLVLMGSATTDTLIGQDTLYSGFLNISGTGGIDGIWNISIYADSLDVTGGGSTIDLDVRFKDSHWPDGKYTAWKTIFSGEAREVTTSKLSIATSDSSWWMPSNVLQYRAIQDTVADNLDTTVIYVGDFIK